MSRYSPFTTLITEYGFELFVLRSKRQNLGWNCNNIEMRTFGGGVGSNFGHSGRGWTGVKKEKFLRTSFKDCPKSTSIGKIREFSVNSGREISGKYKDCGQNLPILLS